SRDKVLGSYGSRDDSPSPAAPAPPRIEPLRPAYGGLGNVTQGEPRREDAQEPVAEVPVAQIPSPQVPPARPYQDTTAEELDVPDFLK
ncbi:MAG: cell division protein FtsZ, partial [Streptomycetaceae bacterium]|nr:cell division protein FtsZ [Streptomycetaceae bacterium]